MTPAQVREHTETDLLDPALQRLVDDADALIAARFGAHTADVLEYHSGGFALLVPNRKVGAVVAIAERIVPQTTRTDGAMTASSATLTAAGASFSASAVRKYIEVAGAGPAGGLLRTTIATFVSATQVTLAAAAVGTVSGALFSYGGTLLDDTDYEIVPGGAMLRRRSGGTNTRGTWADDLVLVYTPLSDVSQRTRVELDLVKLAIHYEAVADQVVGDYRETSVKYEDERDAILGALAPALGVS